VRAAEGERVAAVEPLPPEPPHPRWMNPIRVREALATSSRSSLIGRLRPRRVTRQRRTEKLRRCSSATGRSSSTTLWRATGATRSRPSLAWQWGSGATHCAAQTERRSPQRCLPLMPA
jgi:hypothetical protein